MKSYNLPESTFKVSELQTIYNNCLESYNLEINIIKDKIKKEYGEQNNKLIESLTDKKIKNLNIEKIYKDVIKYIQKYYYETAKGDYYFYDAITKEFIYKEKKDFINECINKIDESFYKSIFQKNDKIYKIVSKIDKPRVYKENGDYFINYCKGYLHSSYKPYNEYPKEIRDKVNMILNMMKEISCSDDEELFDAYIKYWAQLARGIKTDVIIYKKSEEGCGKSTETDFIINYVLGKELCIISNTDPLLTPNNKILMGKILVVFEELPTFSTAQWSAVSSKLKTWSTEKICTYTDKYEKAIPNVENLNNYVINCNVESIKDSNGRRIVILPISTKYMKNHNYFENLRNKCFNLDVGEAFFSYLHEINIDGFSGQKCFPESELKKIAIANQIHPVYKFIKNNYILKNTFLERTKPQELYLYYSTFCKAEGFYPMQKTDFIKKLEDVGIKRVAVNGIQYFRQTLAELQEIAKKYKWLCEYDEVENKDEIYNLDELDDEIEEYENKIKELKEIRDKLLNQV